MRPTSVTNMVIFLKVSFWNYLITAIFKVLSQKLRGILTRRFERYFTVENFTDMDHHHLNIFKQKSTKVPGKLSFTQESEPPPQRTLLQDISIIIVCFFFAQIDLVFWRSSRASTFLYKKQQNLNEARCCFWRFTAAECSYHVFLFH